MAWYEKFCFEDFMFNVNLVKMKVINHRPLMLDKEEDQHDLFEIPNGYH